MSKKKYLVFSPHPDDLDFACSGTSAKLSREGNEVVYCILTRGDKGTQDINMSKDELAATRQREQKAAAAECGVEQVIFLDQDDGELKPTKSLRKKIVEVIRLQKPDTVLSFDPASRSFDNFYRFHRDHRAAAEAVFDALYPDAGSPVFFPELAKAGIEPHTVPEVWFYAAEKPNHYIDITKSIEAKIMALASHKSQVMGMKSIEEMIRDRARKAGQEAGFDYAESFRKLEHG